MLLTSGTPYTYEYMYIYIIYYILCSFAVLYILVYTDIQYSSGSGIRGEREGFRVSFWLRAPVEGTGQVARRLEPP